MDGLDEKVYQERIAPDGPYSPLLSINVVSATVALIAKTPGIAGPGSPTIGRHGDADSGSRQTLHGPAAAAVPAIVAAAGAEPYSGEPGRLSTQACSLRIFQRDSRSRSGP